MNLSTVIKRPLVTEKSFGRPGKTARYAFEVDRLANKYQIKSALENRFKVKITGITASVRKGKTKRQLKSRTTNFVAPAKKVFITLAAGQTIAELEVKE